MLVCMYLNVYVFDPVTRRDWYGIEKKKRENWRYVGVMSIKEGRVAGCDMQEHSLRVCDMNGWWNIASEERTRGRIK